MLTDRATPTQPAVDSEAEVHGHVCDSERVSQCEGESMFGWHQGDGYFCLFHFSPYQPTLHDPASPNAKHSHYRCCDKVMC